MNNLYVFHGADRKVGVTMLVQSIAEYIAGAAPEADILLLTLNGRQNIQYMREEAPPIDTYRNRLESGIAVAKEDLERASGFSNLYIISGIKKETEERFYRPETAESLIRDLRRDFRVIIADTGSDLDNGLAVGGLAAAGKTYLLLSQNEATIRRYEQFRGFYRELGIEFDAVIINKFLDRDPYGLSYLKKRLEIGREEIYKVDMADAGRRAEMEYRTLLDLKSGDYVRDIERIAIGIMAEAGIAARIEKRKSRWKNFI